MNNVIETLKKIIMGIFDFLREVIEGTSKPLNSFLAVFLPLVAAFAMALLTSGNLIKYMDMDSQEAKLYSFLFEGLAIFVFTQLVTAIVSWIKSRNSKTAVLVWVLSALAIAYMAIVLSVNVSLQSSNGIKGINIFVYFMLSLMTPITGIAYGYYLLVMKDNVEHVESKNKDEEIRLEKEEEKKRRWNLKHGFSETGTPMILYNANAGQGVTVDDSVSSSTSTDWRVVSRNLNSKQIEFIANCKDWNVVGKMYKLSERSARNWISNAQKKLGQ